MEKKEIDYILMIGSLWMIVSSIASTFFPFFRWMFIIAVIVVMLHMYLHADNYSFASIGSSKWKTYRYLSLFGLVCVVCIYTYANFFDEGNQMLHANVFLPVIFAVFGNMAPKIPFNKTLGLRLPWTLAREETWHYAHRMIGYVTIPCLLFMMVALMINNLVMYMVSILIWILLPAILSYRYAKEKGYDLNYKLHNPHFLIKAAFAMMFVVSIVMYPALPEQLPMQFASDGSVNWTLPKIFGICVIPLLSIFITGYGKGNEVNVYRGIFAVWLFALLDCGTLVYIAFIM